MGPFRPFLATHPDHVKHVLRVNQRNYVRGGMFWDPLAPLLGNGILSDGESWAESRGILHPMFTAKYVNTLTERMAEIINELIDTTLTPGRPVDVAQAISDLVHPTIVRLLLGAKLPQSDVDRLAPAYDTGVTARSIRLLLPFVPERFPLPGDRAFARAVRTIDGIVYPRIRQVRSEIQLDDDVVSALVRARHGIEGAEGDRRIRDDLVAIHGAATETSATALTWVWPVLDAHPEVAAKVYDEIEHVVGNDPVGTAHLPDLR
ncbi:MAG: cytochrome P450, partial [Nonomuraea sp.]|nr:cytochrome P450 [Nonomuraea sp.]